MNTRSIRSAADPHPKCEAALRRHWIGGTYAYSTSTSTSFDWLRADGRLRRRSICSISAARTILATWAATADRVSIRTLFRNYRSAVARAAGISNSDQQVQRADLAAPQDLPDGCGRPPALFRSLEPVTNGKYRNRRSAYSRILNAEIGILEHPRQLLHVSGASILRMSCLRNTPISRKCCKTRLVRECP
jgi:hypothetical protein